MSKNKLIAMIPARLGSKRIPKKNIRLFAGKPLIQYPIDLALSMGVFDEIWVNTEDKLLGKLAESLGAKFHKRPESLAADHATNRDFTYEFLKNHVADYIVMINTTSPLLTTKTGLEFVKYLTENNYDTLLSTLEERAETFYMDKPLNFTFDEKINSQMLEPTEKVVWALTAWKREVFIKLNDMGINPVFGGVVGKYAIPKDESCDLDTEEDWRLAEGIMISRNISNKKEYITL